MVVPEDPIYKKSALAPTMTWRRKDDKRLPEPKVAKTIVANLRRQVNMSYAIIASGNGFTAHRPWPEHRSWPEQ